MTQAKGSAGLAILTTVTRCKSSASCNAAMKREREKKNGKEVLAMVWERNRVSEAKGTWRTVNIQQRQQNTFNFLDY
ncbi:mCG1045782 [Mus musculus]|nr:mCG1045782 [Mus musculus]